MANVPQPPPSQLPESNAPEADAAAVSNARLAVVASRGGDGLGVSVTVEGTGRIYRIEPDRDPRQPRFWCLRVYRCTSAGVVAPNERSWWGSGGMTRADLPAAIGAVRGDPTAWLAGQEQQELRAWMLESGAA